MALFTGYVALGTGITYNQALTELSGGSYARQALNLVGNFVIGASQSLSAFGAAVASTVMPIRVAAIFDALTGGNQLCSWGLDPPQTPNTTAFPATTINVQLLNGIAASAAITTASFAAGSQIGTVNGRPLIASCQLVIGDSVFVKQGQSLSTSLAVGTMPTTLPAASGVLWNNGGVLSIS